MGMRLYGSLEMHSGGMELRLHSGGMGVRHIVVAWE